MKRTNVRTKRWTRSPRGEIFGVATGLAEWRGLNPEMTRVIVFLLVIFSGIVPGIIIYFLLALILPMQSEHDIIGTYGDSDTVDVHFEEVKEEKSASYDKERDWDERFREGK
ncbi:MAG: PspC domain-containing protein [Spirochaetes bacterium]|uniref:PspC domain-containing protein n=1 Tax=Candidatus Ornithospirochaeta stercoripullorum TaxID=2840899 RepID=A0A9D9H5P4_9SPIO|nr:PspC domain-containing protein [Candidatus Ornithospirochaeta stercoripullorum]